MKAIEEKAQYEAIEAKAKAELAKMRVVAFKEQNESGSETSGQVCVGAGVKAVKLLRSQGSGSASSHSSSELIMAHSVSEQPSKSARKEAGRQVKRTAKYEGKFNNLLTKKNLVLNTKIFENFQHAYFCLKASTNQDEFRENFQSTTHQDSTSSD